MEEFDLMFGYKKVVLERFLLGLLIKRYQLWIMQKKVN